MDKGSDAWAGLAFPRVVAAPPLWQTHSTAKACQSLSACELNTGPGSSSSCQAPTIAWSIHSQVQPPWACGALRRRTDSLLLGTLCAQLKERNLSQHTLPLGLDKAFAVAWLDSDTVVWGTKCNRLVVHHLPTQRFQNIGLQPVHAGISRPAERDNPFGKCGIHAIAINPSQTMLATGGDNPNDSMVFSLPDFKPLKTLLGHQDWVFGLAWLTDQHLVSGGRDGKLKLWKINTRREGLYQDNKSIRTIQVFSRSKIREISWCPAARDLACLDPDGQIQLLDPYSWQVMHTWALPDASQLVSMGSCENVIAVGSEAKLMLIDKRVPMHPAGKYVATSSSRHCDREGFRSIRFNQHIISCGGAYGTLSFWDMRMGRWVSGGCMAPTASGHALHLSSCASSAAADTTQRQIMDQLVFDDRDYMRHGAVYCHAWDASGRRLAAGGGPLAIGLKGMYVGLWT